MQLPTQPAGQAPAWRHADLREDPPLRHLSCLPTYVASQASLARARRLEGLKGYVTNIASEVMDAHAVVAAYHDLWKVEQSFRMAKADLRARPIFHRTRDAIEAHLTVVFAALAVARHLQDVTGMSIKKIVTTLRPLRTVTVAIGDHEMLVEPTIPDAARAVIDAINAG